MGLRFSPRYVPFLVLCLSARASGNEIDWTAVDRLRAAGQLQQALDLVRSAAMPQTLKAAGTEQRLLQDLARYSEAQKAGLRWIQLATKAGDRQQLAEAEHRTGRSFISQQKNDAAADHFRRAAEQAETLNDDNLYLLALVDLSQAETNMARYTEGENLLARAELLWKRKRDPLLGIRIKQRLGWTLHVRGKSLEALPYLEEALALSSQSKPARRSTLNMLGQAHIALHRYAEALDFLSRVMAEDPDPSLRTLTLVSIGMCQREMNRLEEAGRTFHDARKLAVELRNPGHEAFALGELGLTAQAEGDGAAAIRYYDLALQGHQKSKDVRNALVVLANKARVYRFQQRYDEALRLYREAERRTLEIPGLEPAPFLIKAIGQCLVGLGRFEEGEKLVRLSIEKALATGDTKRVWEGYQEMARLHRKRKEVPEADAAFQRALDAIELTRRSLRLEAFKTDFFGDKVQVYEEYADLLISDISGETGVARAFAIAERARSRSFLDSLAESRAAVDELLPGDIVRSEEAIFTEISALQGRIRKGENTPEVRFALSEKEKQLEGLHLRVRSNNPRFQQVRYPQPADYPALRKVLRPDELVLEFLIGEQSSYAWVASPTGLEYFSLPARAELERLVRSSYAQMLQPSAPPVSVENLSSLLLGPIARAEGGGSLVIIPSGILHYFPFEVLPAGPQRQPLMKQFRVSYMPSASTLVEARGRKSTRLTAGLLALGDAVYDGKLAAHRSGALVEAGDLASLPHTRTEVNTLRSLFGSRHSTILLGKDATERNLKQQDLRRYSVIHLAAHGILDSSSSSRSGLVLGMDAAAKEDGILQVREVYRLPLNASLVTLSACQSALGRLLTGEGMVGLSRAFFYAGADTIVASLWNVNDEAAAEFMARFYRRLKRGESKEEALRQAKLSMAAEERYRNPYYWAAYVLIGDGSEAVPFPRDWTGVMVLAASLALLIAVFLGRRYRTSLSMQEPARRT